MKPFCFVVLLILGLVTEAWCSTCNIDGHILQEEESYQPVGQCKLYNCYEDGVLAEQTCPDIRPQAGCVYVEMNNTKPFPDCCPHYVCPQCDKSRI